eukprot:CAMPEP_0196717098 /NCGR_PEP_ID=MMETSP1091-20130531/510_1 /TAXON_ID=302021 /ORGANISM="Rhodomonas sp., Strain CCMP768" /LENGTH=52 /DNA_ID=CAMNT_0042057323 /DNA_START=24 /DNA_END=178 /DNA_ORIENTATION=+
MVTLQDISDTLKAMNTRFDKLESDVKQVNTRFDKLESDVKQLQKSLSHCDEG